MEAIEKGLHIVIDAHGVDLKYRKARVEAMEKHYQLGLKTAQSASQYGEMKAGAALLSFIDDLDQRLNTARMQVEIIQDYYEKETAKKAAAALAAVPPASSTSGAPCPSPQPASPPPEPGASCWG